MRQKVERESLPCAAADEPQIISFWAVLQLLLIARRRKLQPKDYWAEAELEADAALAAGTEGVELLQSEKQGGKQS